MQKQERWVKLRSLNKYNFGYESAVLQVNIVECFPARDVVSIYLGDNDLVFLEPKRCLSRYSDSLAKAQLSSGKIINREKMDRIGSVYRLSERNSYS